MENEITRRHNETFLCGDAPCMDCKSKDNIIWSTRNVFWNGVMDRVDGSGILCVYCFVSRAEKIYEIKGWELNPSFLMKKN